MCSVVVKRYLTRKGHYGLLRTNTWRNSGLNDKFLVSHFHSSGSKHYRTIWAVGSLLSAGAVGIGAVLVYAKFNPQLQNTFDEKVNHVKDVFASFLGESIPQSRNNKELEVVELKKLNGQGRNTIHEKLPIGQGEGIKTNVDGSDYEDLLQEMHERKEGILVLLQEFQSRLKEASDAASIHLKEAIELLSSVDLDDSDWNDLRLKAENRASKIQNLNDIHCETIAAIRKFELLTSNLGSEGKKDELLFFQKYLKDSKEKLRDIENGVLSSLRNENASTGEFRSLIEEGWDNLKRELPALLPDIKSDDKVSKLSDKELDVVLSHYQKKVLHLLATSAYQQTVQNKVLLQELEKNREESGEKSGIDIEESLTYQKKYINILHQRELSEVKARHEADLEREFKKQAVAYAEHLKETIQTLEAAIVEKYNVQLQEGLKQEKFDYHRELAKFLGQLKGVEESLRARFELEMASRKAQALWVACQNFSASIDGVEAYVVGQRAQLNSVGAQIEAIKRVSGNDPFVANILNSLPEEATDRGIFTKAALRERFIQVEKMCKNVALISDNGGSLFQYLLSYLQSFMLINSSKGAFVSLDPNDEVIDVNSLSTLEIVDRARVSVDKENFGQALKFMNLLTGGPTEVARDWIHDVRLYLEVSQAAEALLLHASAVDIKAYAD